MPSVSGVGYAPNTAERLPRPIRQQARSTEAGAVVSKSIRPGIGPTMPYARMNGVSGHIIFERLVGHRIDKHWFDALTMQVSIGNQYASANTWARCPR